MLDQRVIELYTRKMTGEATAAEIRELNEYLGTAANVQDTDALDTKELLDEIWKLEKQEENTDLFYKRHIENHGTELDWIDQDKQGRINRIFSLPGAGRGRGRSLLVLAFRIACVFAGIVTLGYFLFVRKSNDNRVHASEVVTGKGVRKSVRLPDGTMVWLNADSRISYDEHMNEKESRSVNLAGEAFFDVAHDKDRPFIIHTNQISVRVLGTSFNVKAYPNEPVCEATLLNGSIELSINKRPQQKIILKPSEKFALIEANRENPGKDSSAKDLMIRGISEKESGDKDTIDLTGGPGDAMAAMGTVNPGGAVGAGGAGMAGGQSGQASDQSPDLTLSIERIKPIEIDHHNYVKETSWKDNRLVFDAEPFKELKTSMERWYNVRIELRGKKISNYRFTGIFTTETVEQALNAMRLIKPFNYKMNNNEIIIY